MMRLKIDNKSWSELIFLYQQKRNLKWLVWIGISVLFLGGLALWGLFLNWGNGPYNFHDWADINMPRLYFLQDSLKKGVLPLHISNSSPLDSATDRFMAVPDVILSPQILLLLLLSVQEFVLVNTWLLYSAGFVGLLWLRKKFRLSLTAFTIFFLFFNFNGHILAHFTVGHFTWVTYFLYPWFIGLIFDLLEGHGNWKWTAKTSLWMLLVFINGGYHQFIWALFFMAFLLLTNSRNFWIIIRTVVFSIAICTFRIIPLMLPLGEFDNIFIAGYPHWVSIWSSLINFQIPNDITLNDGMTRAVGLWEFTLYIGLLGAIFLLFFGIFRIIEYSSNDNRSELLLPSAGLIILSIGKVYQYLRIALPFPPITGERVPSRMIILAFLFILTLAIIELQHLLEREDIPIHIKLLAPALGIIVSNDLWQNFRLWRLRDAADAFPVKIINPGVFFVANYSDPDYFTMLWIGLTVSLITICILFYLVRNENKKARRISVASDNHEPS